MAGTKNHVLVVPKAVFILRCFQLATAVAVMGLMAYGITFYSFDADNLMMFTVRPLPLYLLLLTNISRPLQPSSSQST